MNKKDSYAIIYDSGDLVQCRGVCSYYEAIGKLICYMTDSIDEWLRNDYKLIKKDDFVNLEGDTGYGWFVELYNEERNITIRERWLLLVTE